MVKRAVVLGGGGSRGPYQIGVWQAMRELGLDFQIITGSSVGTLNGALMVQDDYQLAKELWENLTFRDVVAEAPDLSSPSGQELLVFVRHAVERGGMDISPLEDKIRRCVDEDRVRSSPIEFGLVTAKYPFLTPVQLVKSEIPRGELVDYMLASAAWFPFFQKKEIGGVQYLDGAYCDNLPAELALKCGATELVVVDIHGRGIVHHYRSDVPVTYIRSHWNLGAMMIFEAENARRNHRLGYQDTMKAYRRLEGEAYAFYRGETRKNTLALKSVFDSIRRHTGVSLFRNYQRLPKIHQMLRFRNNGRFLHQPDAPFTVGLAVTSAAEIAGELLHIPPDHIYTLSEFNGLLLEQSGSLLQSLPGTGESSLFYTDSGQSAASRRRIRGTLRRLYRMLESAYATGKTPDAFWGLATVSPVEFIAAYYLLALNLRQNRSV